jgi:hypothetical protein
MHRLAAILVVGLGCWAALSAPARAALIITAEEVGSDVVFTYSGSIDLTGAPVPTVSGAGAFINPSVPALSFRTYASGAADGYLLPSPPPAFAAFGAGGANTPDSQSGDILRISGSGSGHEINLPSGYTSGSALSGSMTFNSDSFATLGLTPGVYVWDLTFTGGPAQDATITVVPEPSAAIGIGALLALARGADRRRRTR